MAFSETTKAVKSAKAKGGVIKKINDGIAAKEAEKKKDAPPAEPGGSIPPDPAPQQKPGHSVQPPLPNTEEGAPQMSDELKELLPRVDNAIYQAATWKQTENDLKETIKNLMAAEHLNEVGLPGLGKLRYSPGKPKVTYIKPPPAAAKGSEGDGEETDGDEE